MKQFDQRLLASLTGRVLVLTGSGISADSGIPTFRGEGGYWRTFKAEDLATQRAFDRDPAMVWRWYRERREVIAAALPNAAHVALVALAERCREFLLVTQNVDDLHERATLLGRSLPPSKLVHIHGEIFVTRCTRCAHVIREPGASPPSAPEVPQCPLCLGPMRPGVVWFDEELDPDEMRRVRDFLTRGDCDLVLCVGTTATFDYIQQWALGARGRNGWLVEINLHETVFSPQADRIIRERAAVVLPELANLSPGLER